jgi:hypothetical protein
MKGDSLNGKLQIPIPKSQTNLEFPNPEAVLEASPLLGFGIYFGAWVLGFGISDRLFLQRIDSFGEIEIQLRQPAFAVR